MNPWKLLDWLMVGVIACLFALGLFLVVTGVLDLVGLAEVYD